jgi:hypothetical protein
MFSSIAATAFVHAWNNMQQISKRFWAFSVLPTEENRKLTKF